MSGMGKKCRQNDRPQKLAAKWYLESIGYEDVRIISVGSDITCRKDGMEYRVEVLVTETKDRPWGISGAKKRQKTAKWMGVLLTPCARRPQQTTDVTRLWQSRGVACLAAYLAALAFS